MFLPEKKFFVIQDKKNSSRETFPLNSEKLPYSKMHEIQVEVPAQLDHVKTDSSEKDFDV
jgi:hypothetical protein